MYDVKPKFSSTKSQNVFEFLYTLPNPLSSWITGIAVLLTSTQQLQNPNKKPICCVKENDVQILINFTTKTLNI